VGAEFARPNRSLSENSGWAGAWHGYGAGSVVVCVAVMLLAAAGWICGKQLSVVPGQRTLALLSGMNLVPAIDSQNPFWMRARGGVPKSSGPADVYVDDDYRQKLPGTPVDFPDRGVPGDHTVGLDAFGTVQEGVEAVATGGCVKVAAGTYVEHITINKSLILSGPNADRAGADPGREPEAQLIMDIDDPENTPVIAVEADQVTIEGLCIDGANTNHSGGYLGRGARLNAAAGVQNGVYNLGLADFDHLTVRNCLIRNVSYDGIYLDRFDYLATSSAYNYIVSNKFENTWEGLLTYAVDTVIEGNTITNVVHGLSLHAGMVPVPSDFVPRVVSNHLTIAEWFPEEMPITNAPGIWINYRRAATPLAVAGNRIDTPTAAPPGKRILGLYALNVDDGARLDFIGNEVHGSGHCDFGAFVAKCSQREGVRIVGGILEGIQGIGVLASTRDWTWGSGDCSITLSNVSIQLASADGGIGVQAWQDSETPTNTVGVVFVGDSTVRGAAVGIQAVGQNASLLVRSNAAPVAGNAIGIEIDGGKAAIESNDLAGNTVAAIRVLNQALVDAGNCSGLNLTGLGSSAGHNRFSGYLGGTAKAIVNASASGPAVSAQDNDFGAIAGQNISDALVGLVEYSQAGALLVSCPVVMGALSCLGDLPPAADSLLAFVAQGGSVSASAASVSAADQVTTNGPGWLTVTRSYSVTDAFCGKTGQCDQNFQVVTDRPVLSLPERCDPGWQITVRGVVGSSVVLEASSDLRQWERVETNRVPYSHAETNDNSLTGRFYRARYAP